MCIVFLDIAPGRGWPVVVAAVRDEFADRPWSPPAAHWPDLPHVVGPRDDSAGGTWLAVDERSPALALVVNRRSRRLLIGDAARAASSRSLRFATGPSCSTRTSSRDSTASTSSSPPPTG